MSKTVLYMRVSSKDQTIAHQLTQAEAAGFKIDETVADEGVSGVSTMLAERPQGRRLFDMLRSGDVLVVRWIDRLGRNYQDVADTVDRFLKKGVTIRTVINNLTFDGTPSDAMQMAVRDALIRFMAAMAQSQAEATKEAQRAGIEHARSKIDNYLGRKPVFTQAQFEEAQSLLAQDVPVYQIAKKLDVSRQTIMRMRDNPERTIEILKAWKLWK